MSKLLIDLKDGKFMVSVIPYLENTFVIDEIDISEEAANALLKQKRSKAVVQKFAREWLEKVLQLQ